MFLTLRINEKLSLPIFPLSVNRNEWKENLKVIDRSKTISYSSKLFRVKGCYSSDIVTFTCTTNINTYIQSFLLYITFFSRLYFQLINQSKIFTLPFKNGFSRYKFGTDRSMEEREKLWRQNSGVFSLRHESSLWRK